MDDAHIRFAIFKNDVCAQHAPVMDKWMRTRDSLPNVHYHDVLDKLNVTLRPETTKKVAGIVARLCLSLQLVIYVKRLRL